MGGGGMKRGRIEESRVGDPGGGGGVGGAQNDPKELEMGVERSAAGGGFGAAAGTGRSSAVCWGGP